MLKWGEVRRRVRYVVVLLGARTWVWVNDGLPSAENPEYRAPVIFGPLRGYRMAVPNAFRLAYWLGTMEPHTVQAMRRHMAQNAVCYDIGGHIGYLALVAGRLATRVYTFEPDPVNLHALRQNVANNGVPNVHVVPSAVADVEAELCFATFAYSSVNHLARDEEPEDARVIRVPCTTVDAFVEEGHDPPTFIKIDVEGAEERVLRGAKLTLSCHHPTVVVEVRREYLRGISSYMAAMGYDRHILKGGLSDMERNGIADVLFIVA